MRPQITCALMMDLRGRSIRISRFLQDESQVYKEGEKVEFRTDGFDINSTHEEVQINFYDLPPIMREGDLIIIGDKGEVQGVINEISRTSFSVEIMQGGMVHSYAAVKIPGQRIQQLPIVQLEDKVDIKEIATKYNFDYLVLPQVQSGRDIQELRMLLNDSLPKVQLIAKIDTLDAVQNFSGIIKQADGIVVLRNELAMELDPEKLMLAQKWMIQTANTAAVPIYLQSQVLEGIVRGDSKAIRLETQEISTSVIEGVDGFILSHETSVCKQSTEATVLLAKSIVEAENVYDHEQAYQELRNIAKQQGSSGSVLDMLCSTAMQIALDNSVMLFIVMTENGRIARYLAK